MPQVFRPGVSSGVLPTTGGGTVDATDATGLDDETPKGGLVVFVASNASLGSVDPDGFSLCIGFFDGSTVRCIGIVLTDGISTDQGYHRGMNDKVGFLFAPGSDDVIDGECTITLIPNGITLTASDAFSTDYRFITGFFADGPDGTVECKVLEIDTGVTQDIDPGWSAGPDGRKDPDLVIFAAQAAHPIDDTSQAPCYMTFGVAANTPNGPMQTSWNFRSEKTTTFGVSNVHTVQGISEDHDGTAPTEGYSAVTAFDSSGFVMGGTAGGTNVYAALCVRSWPRMAARVMMGTIPQGATPGEVNHDRAGIQPRFGLILTGFVTDGSHNELITNNGASSVGIGLFRDVPGETMTSGAVSISSRDAQATADTKCIAGSGCVEGLGWGATHQQITGAPASVHSDGFRVNYTAGTTLKDTLLTAMVAGDPSAVNVKGAIGTSGAVTIL